MTQTPEPYSTTASTPPNAAVGFGDAISLGFKNYANFGGLSSRAEYWWFTLFIILVSFGTGIIGTATGTGVVIGWLWGLATLLPQLAVAVRRLRDAGYHWAFLFLAFIPVVGAIVLIVLLASPGRVLTR